MEAAEASMATWKVVAAGCAGWARAVSAPVEADRLRVPALRGVYARCALQADAARERDNPLGSGPVHGHESHVDAAASWNAQKRKADEQSSAA